MLLFIEEVEKRGFHSLFFYPAFFPGIEMFITPVTLSELYSN